MISTESFSKEWIIRRSQEFQNGIMRIKEFMYQRNYYIEHAVVDAAKVAYLATCFQNGITKIQKYSKEQDLHALTVFDKMPKELQRFRKSSPEAFYYWAKTFEMI